MQSQAAACDYRKKLVRWVPHVTAKNGSSLPEWIGPRPPVTAMSGSQVKLYTSCMTLSDTAGGLLASVSDGLAGAVQRAGRSVVAVHGRRRFPASGIAWRDDQVVTASHVLERDSDLPVTSSDGAQHPARIVGRGSGSDLAVLAVQGAWLHPI